MSAKSFAAKIAADPNMLTASEGEKCLRLVEELVKAGLLDLSKPRTPRGLGLKTVAPVLGVSHDELRGTVCLCRWKAGGDATAKKDVESIRSGGVTAWGAYTAILHKRKELRDLKAATKAATKAAVKASKSSTKKSSGAQIPQPVANTPPAGHATPQHSPSLGAVQLITGPEMVVAHLNDIGFAFSALSNSIDSFQRKLVSGGEFGAFIRDRLVPMIYEAQSAFLTEREREYAQQLALSEILKHGEQ